MWGLSSHPFHPTLTSKSKCQGTGYVSVRPASYRLGRMRRIFWISNRWAPGSMRDLKNIIQLESNQEKRIKIDLWHLHTGRCTRCIYIAHPYTHVLYTQHKREGEGKRGKREYTILEIPEISTLCLCVLVRKAVVQDEWAHKHFFRIAGSLGPKH